MRKAPWMMILVAAMLGLLPVLAALQYHWLGQVSQAEKDRMQSSLRLAANNFAMDFDRELARAFFTFQMGPFAYQERRWDEFAERYNQWTASPHPRLVKNVFLLEADKEGVSSISKFDAAEKTFKPSDWPSEFEDLRRRFESQYKIISPDENSFISVSMTPIDQDIPALLIPLPHTTSLPRIAVATVTVDKRDSEVEANLAFSPPSGYLAVALDLDYIKSDLFPKLVKKYFENEALADYNIAIMGGDAHKDAIYKSDPHLSNDAYSKADATVGLLRVRFGEFNALFLDGAWKSEGILKRRSPPNVDEFISRSNTVRIFHQSMHTKESSKNDDKFEVPADVKLMRAAKDATKEDIPWELMVKHRAGSLEAAVGHARRRNLAISFGILLLLGTSMVMLLVSTRRAQRLAQQQMEFVAGVSHELRTPLAVIYSAGENLADGLIGDPKQIKRYGSLIKSEGRRLTEMVEQALEFAGSQSGRKKYQLQAADPAAILEDALASTDSILKDGGFEIAKQIEEKLPLVLADPPALSRSLQNLLNNAVKYSGDCRRIAVRARSVKKDRNLEVEIAVEDKGIGIAPSELPHIFEPFYRGQEVTAAQIHGSGLGLSLVKQIVEICGGRVSVESELGRGSTFTIRLPAAAESDAAENGAAKEEYEQADTSR